MTVVRTTQDPEALTLTIEAEFAAPPSRVWQIWVDPRQLERWWGPPTWPATFTELDPTVGGTARYHMTGPDGETSHGYWRFTTVEEPSALGFEDGFADAEGVPNTEMPTTDSLVRLTDAGGSTRMTLVSTFATAETMQQLVQMGMVEGITAAMGQIDDILAAA